MELRRFSRAPLQQPLEFSSKAGPSEGRRVAGLAKDISLGGMFIETSQPAAFGADITVFVVLPGEERELQLPGVVRWTRPDGMGVQFGLVGARETFAITEIVKKADPSA